MGKTVGFYKLSYLGYAAYSLQETDSEVVPVEFVSGNAMCFRRCVLADVGNYLFDDRLNSYAEDLDLCIRLKKTKWGMVVRPKAVVYHYREQAFAGKPLDQLRKLIHVSSNRLWVYYKNLPFAKFMLKLPALLCGIPSKVARPDGARNFQPVHFSAAFILVPFIFVYFWIKLFQSFKNAMDKSSQP
jgi:GT2 family glycosyltransferase